MVCAYNAITIVGRGRQIVGGSLASQHILLATLHDSHRPSENPKWMVPKEWQTGKVVLCVLTVVHAHSHINAHT